MSRIIFENGTVYDGTGAPGELRDLWIEDGLIVSDNAFQADKADRVIDCGGLAVAPGFIDAHSHNDFFYDYQDSEDYFRPFIRQGITTQITGNCGFSSFGVEKESPHRAKVGGSLFRAEEPGSFGCFLERAKGRLFVNIAPLIGHGTVRTSVSGLDPRPLTAEEINRELALVDEAMEKGALGGSFGFMYEPGMYSRKEELLAFAGRIAEYDGILTVHPRANSRVALGYPLISRPHIELGLDEVVDIMEQTGVRTEYSHLIFVGRASWKSVGPMLKKFHDLNAAGKPIAYDNYALDYGASVITVVMPAWYMALPPEKKRAPLNRLKLKVMINITKALLGIDFRDMAVAYISEGLPQYEGKNVEELAREEGISPFDMYLKLVELSKGQGRIYLGKYYNAEIIRRLMEDELSVFMTDAWVEPSGVQNGSAFQCFPLFLQMGERFGMPLETVIHKMTGKTARRFRLEGRGILAPGNFADVTVFDPKGIVTDLSVPDFTPKGIEYVLINGEFAVDAGEYKTQTSGQVILRRGRESGTPA